ncbi:DUF262 domain-containing protein [Xanthomonas cannabis]|uniref:DUF262 domain-containing protein n=1 Tax=Xanthomonas cannabis TaxID=1885674 RepID=UPI00057541B7|nr:DUF262 domain-containing protein [Xanthomonas cannabis]KHL59315.1 hypothetical protein OZ13_02165 [Xanthomonas cannabis pv. cannabis]
MEANTRNLKKLLEAPSQYQVPLFQRPYVWQEQDNWLPLWEDIEALLDKNLYQKKAHPHFLGAVVFEQVNNQSGTVQLRLVIDGQQRFTTLQLFLIAARNLAAKVGTDKQKFRLNTLIENAEMSIDEEHEKYKLLPTNADREVFKEIHACQSYEEVKALYLVNSALISNRLIGAYAFFAEKLSAWVDGADVDQDCKDAFAQTSVEDRIECIWKVATDGLQLVVIDLTQGDETQVIFETLNARGTDLLPADLIKNLLFRNAIHEPGGSEASVEKLHEKHWQKIDNEYWREEVTQGRLKRPRIDLFINHYLSMMLKEEVRATHLFNEYKKFFDYSDEVSIVGVDVPKTPSEHIIQLAKFGEIFRKFYEPRDHTELALFLRRLDAVGTATVYPLLLYIYARLMPNNVGEFNKILRILESFLMRRLIINLTPKNYNKLFIDLIKAIEKSEELTAETVGKLLARGQGDSTKFPTDEELTKAVMHKPFYGRISQAKVRAVLEALDDCFRSGKSEALAMPDDLTIEHVLPQTWETHWPIPADIEDHFQRSEFRILRDDELQSLGNLTLITGKFNASLQNGSWDKKRPELMKFSRLNLTRYFADIEVWDEDAIETRGKLLLAQLIKLWPAPDLSDVH